MANITVNTPVGTPRVLRFIEGIAADISAWNAQRRTRTALERLTPEQLEDIGLTKADVADMFLIRG